ncbi:MAG: tRNA dihydrouridine(20/20a) synthase DusA [Rickettsiales bacterium]|nr:tRNA dihydrouridine(20/20a) synthase DusA [Rickettsiales bacterium]
MPLSVAPMMKVTDRHFRRFVRCLTRRTLLYTEMVTTGALLRGDTERWLGFSAIERPLALQLGGDDPGDLARCARLAEERGYDEVNLNVGCPSPRVQTGNFGACLMEQPQRVAEAVAEMRAAVTIPVTVKHRIGVDALDRYEDMARFVEVVAESGCDRFIVHARKAWLKGLSPKENRTIPPLRYGDVHQLKTQFPALLVEINGGFAGLDAILEQLQWVDGVMVGRAADSDPYLLAEVDREVFGDRSGPVPSRAQVVQEMSVYIAEWLTQGLPLHRVTRHMLGLYRGCSGARAWRRTLSERGADPSAGLEVLTQAMAQVDGAAPF